jgi:4-hydroxybenzoate polyprenyltransferase
VLGVDWGAVGLAGSFAVGAAFGVILTLRLAKVLATFFADLIRRHPDHPPD